MVLEFVVVVIVAAAAAAAVKLFFTLVHINHLLKKMVLYTS